MNNNIDMGTLMNLLSKIDKKNLEKSIEKANEIMNSKDKDKLIEDLTKKLK